MWPIVFIALYVMTISYSSSRHDGVFHVEHLIELGLEVNKPFGDSARYDFIVQEGGRMAQVQVKSTIVRANGGIVPSIEACAEEEIGFLLLPPGDQGDLAPAAE